ncbi:MAG: Hpt domain-containing protein [Candidatus Omnitrophica bacterium]|nr:Hpt domain-containing protein [Candidatus Omnitrophota bacterium]
MSDVVDLKDAMDRVQDDKELLCELFDIFCEDFPPKRDKIWAAFEKGDAVAFQMIAHGFKGATGNISARQMHETCVQLDAMGKAGSISAAKPLLEGLDRQFADLKVEIVRLKKDFGK